MTKQGNKYLAIVVVFTLAIHLLCIHEAAGVKSLNVTVLVHHVEVDVGGTVNVTVRYENTGDEALDLKLTIFDEGDNPSSPRPVLTYDSYQISAIINYDSSLTLQIH